MSKRYEWLDTDQVEWITDPADLIDLDPDGFIAPPNGALVVGNPWTAAGVIEGSRAEVVALLRKWLALVEADEPSFTFPVTVQCATREQARQVLAERLDPDEDYGFEYRLDWQAR